MGDLHDSREYRLNRARKLAYDRANDTPCGICRGAYGPIDYSVPPGSTDLSWECDHIRPVTKRPDLAACYENLQAAHRMCNRRKGNKAGFSDLGNTSVNLLA